MEQQQQNSETPKIPEWATHGRDVAEAEFQRWAKSMGLQGKFDESLLTEKEIVELSASKSLVISAIMDGRLIVNDDGEFEFTPADVGKDKLLGTLLFAEPKMSDIRDATKKENKVEQQILLMARLTGKSEIQLMAMRNRNSSVCNAIVGLFLG